jgi:transposase-like protein
VLNGQRKPDAIVLALRDADRMLVEGRTTAEVAAALGVSRSTYYRWRRVFGARGRDRVASLARENEALRRILVDRELENDALRELARRRW